MVALESANLEFRLLDLRNGPRTCDRGNSSIRTTSVARTGRRPLQLGEADGSLAFGCGPGQLAHI